MGRPKMFRRQKSTQATIGTEMVKNWCYFVEALCRIAALFGCRTVMVTQVVDLQRTDQADLGSNHAGLSSLIIS